jgi:6-phosphogluconolactonase (cycloisomerase 2 family)
MTGHAASAVALLLAAGLAWPAQAGFLTEVAVLPLPDGVESLDGVNDVAVSPDGQHVYAASSTSDSLLVAGWNPGLQRFELIQEFFDGSGGVNGLDSARAVVVAPDGGHVYVGAGIDTVVSIFGRDGGTGALTFLGVEGTGRVADLVPSADGEFLYVAALDQVRVYDRNPATGALALVETLTNDTIGGGGAFFVIGLDDPAGMALSPAGDHLYVSASGSDAVTVFARDAVTGSLTFLVAEFDGFAGMDGLDGANAVAVSPDGTHVYVAGGVDGAVAIFDRDPVTGELTWVESVFDDLGGVDGLDGATDVVVSADGAYVYVAGTGDDAIAVFARDALTGALTFVERLLDDVGGVDGLDGISGLAVDPSESYVFAAGGTDDAVAALDRDAGTGQLSFSALIRDGLFGFSNPARMALSPDGLHVYVTDGGNDSVQVLDRDPVTDALTPSSAVYNGFEGTTLLEAPGPVAISPDGGHVYVASTIDDTLSVFDRDAVTGELTQTQVVEDDVGGVDGLNSSDGMAISPDGSHLYVTSNVDDSVAIFGRDPGTGLLSFLDLVKDAIDVGNLNGAFGIGISPDGAYVYVAAGADDAVVTFGRDAGTGALTLIDERLGGAVVGPSGLRVTDDGANVYVGVDDGVVAYARDAVTGLLSQIQAELSNTLAFPFDLFESSAGDQVWTTNGGALALYLRDDDGRLGLVQTQSLNSGALVLSPGSGRAYAATRTTGSYPLSVVTFELGPACPAVPLGGCRVPGLVASSKVKLVHTPPKPGSLKWVWKAAGEPTEAFHFGDPLDDTNYSVCGYDESGAPTLIFEAGIPAGSDWSENSIGFRLRDSEAAPDGIATLVLRAPIAGKGVVKVKGKGELLTVPPLPVAVPLRFQLQGSHGECWEATFSGAGLKRSNDRVFVGTSD